MTPTSSAYRLFHEGSLALAELEHNGIRIDTEYLDSAIARVDRITNKLYKKLTSDKIYKLWRRKKGDKTNLTSSQQLGDIIFGELGYDCPSLTATGKYKTDDATLKLIDLPFVRDWQRHKNLKHQRSTFLMGIKREVVDGFLHPVFNLHTVQTMRGSSDSPNFQNIPVRDLKLQELIRRAFVSRIGRRLVENDFGALEFCIAACWWKDPRMVEYASDPTKDIHRDMAMEIFMLPKEQVNKNTRYTAKNNFVFPELYGSYYLHICQNIWENIDNLKLETVDGVPIKEHLKKKGIKRLGNCDPELRPAPGTFEYHVKSVEDRLMQRFSVFAQKKEDWYQQYRRKGAFRLMTGFVINGCDYSKNDLMNYPIQGPGFHCLLWTIIRMLKKLKKRQMKSLLVGQIHDCAIGDVPDRELQTYLNMIHRIVTVELPKKWPWIIVPLKIEAEVCPVNGTWFDKKAWVMNKNGLWEPKA